VRARPEDAAALLHLGAARALAGDADEARRAFLAAAVRAEDDATASLAYYDLGVVALEQGDLESAREAFFDAIALAPGDTMAQFNLEWTLRALATTPPLPPLGPSEPGPPESEGEPRDQRQEGEGEPSGEGRREAERAVGTQVEMPPATPPTLDADRARHWLDAVREDPSRALRNAVAAERQEPRRGPRW
jgi:tetratricopeptide (TPR) repeat protein